MAEENSLLSSLESLLDNRLQTFEQKINDISQNQISAVSSMGSYTFKKKGHEQQFTVNAQVLDKMRQADSHIANISGDDASSSARNAREKIYMDILLHRQKCIKLADSSEHGWRVVQEYEALPLAEDSDDEKKIYRALIQADRKVRQERRARSRRFAPYTSTKPSTDTRPNTQQTSNRKPDLCFKCGKSGHWRAECRFEATADKSGNAQITIPELAPSQFSSLRQKSLPNKLEEVIEEEDSFQLLENIPVPVVSNYNQHYDGDMKIHTNPAMKELFEPQDLYQKSCEELEAKAKKFKELEAFTQYERKMEAEQISSLKTDLKKKAKELNALKANLPWLEEELMKTQGERNSLQQKVDTLNAQLGAVADGTGLTKTTAQLKVTETKVTDLNTDLEVQKSQYEFHIQQLKRKLEVYTLMLEEKGVTSEEIEARLAASNIEHCDGKPDSSSQNDEVAQLKEKHEQELNELRSEVNMLVIDRDKGILKIQEMQRDNENSGRLSDVNGEGSIGGLDLQKEMIQAKLEKLKENFNELKLKHESETNDLQAKMRELLLQLDTEKSKNGNVEMNLHNELLLSEREETENRYIEEIADLKSKLSENEEILEKERAKVERILESVDERRTHSEEQANMKQMYEEKEQNKLEINNSNKNKKTEIIEAKYSNQIVVLKQELDKFTNLYEIEKEKNESRESTSVLDENLRLQREEEYKETSPSLPMDDGHKPVIKGQVGQQAKTPPLGRFAKYSWQSSVPPQNLDINSPVTSPDVTSTPLQKHSRSKSVDSSQTDQSKVNGTSPKNNGPVHTSSPVKAYPFSKKTGPPAPPQRHPSTTLSSNNSTENDADALENGQSEKTKSRSSSPSPSASGTLTKKREAIIAPINTKKISKPGGIKKVIHPCHSSVPGSVLTCKHGKLARVNLPNVIQVCASTFHCVCLTYGGEVYTFGFNDEGTLGRDTSKEGSEMTPGKVEGLPKIVQVCAGDSHTAALSEDGRVYAWGNFSDAKGSMGLTSDGIQNKPIPMLEGETIVKIISGGDHLVCLSNAGEIFTCGCAEQGQLGRVAERFSKRGGRRGLDYFLQPELVRFRRKKTVFSDIWAGQFITFAQEKNTGEIYGWGLNNYFQLGFSDMTNRFMPEKIKSFDGKSWTMLQGGQHHTVALDDQGNVYTLGRSEYGRLGLGENCEEKKEPTLVKLTGKCTSISAGQACSFALMEDGSVSCWGMGTSKQLGNGEEDDAWLPTKMAGKQLNDRKVVQVSSGGQHTVLLVVNK